MTTLYSRIKRISDKTNKPEHYATDLTVHDKRALRKAKPGDVFLWGLRSMGTHLINTTADEVTKNELDSFSVALNWFDAINDSTDVEWHCLECLGNRGHGTTFPIEADAARAILTRNMRAIESALGSHKYFRAA